MKQTGYTVLPMEKSHLSEVARLEAECFCEPWSESSLELLLGEGAMGFVCRLGDEVIAYGGILFVLDEGQISNIAVRESHRRQGCGDAILTAVLQDAQARGVKKVFLEVRASNLGAQHLYRKHGFAAVGMRKDFYRHPREDGLVMCKEL